MASSWNNVDCREMIEYNLGMMMKVLKHSNDPKKRWKIESYQKALDNMYKVDQPVYSTRDLIHLNRNSTIAGGSILEKMSWIVTNKVNLPEVELFAKKCVKSVKKNNKSVKPSKKTVIDDVDSSEEDEWSFTDDDTESILSEEESVTQEVNEDNASDSSYKFDYENDQRVIYLSTICHIEGQMYSYLDVNNHDVRRILEQFNKLRNKYKVLNF